MTAIGWSALRQRARDGRGILRHARAARRLAREVRLPVFRPVIGVVATVVQCISAIGQLLLVLFYREPLLRYHSARVGRRLHLEGAIPEIIGEGCIEIGDDVTIGAPCTWDLGYNLGEPPRLIIGNRVSINYRNVISVAKSVVIGDDTMIAGNVLIFDNISHPISPRRRLARDHLRVHEAEPVTIGKNVWIGVNAVILRGVSIGDNSIVAAGSVVTKPVPPNTLVAGNPARPIKSIADE